ncbi:MAG: ABC transporter permease [Paludibacter sp.]|nr:ABC transporter permease [Paludibacter sp.]
MSVEYFIAKRIHFQQGKKNISRPAVRIATIAIALGMAVMILAVSIVLGFKQEIRNKIIGFGGHIQITNYDNNDTYEMQPVRVGDAFLADLSKVPGVSHIQFFATKPGMIKTKSDFQGVVIKGVGPDFDWNFFKANMVDGDILHYNKDSLTNKVIVSKTLADMLGLKTEDNFLAYFIQAQTVRARKFQIAGIYSTNFVDYDKLFVLTDIRHIQYLNGWDEKEYGGIEILTNDFNKLEETAFEVDKLATKELVHNVQAYFTQTIKQLNPQVFGWLNLLDMNVWVILGLMLAVAGFNMISSLLILILERTNMIGILKSVGFTNWSIRKIFLYHSFFLIGKGMLWGNVVGLLLAAVQYYTHVIPLDPESYYVSYVPLQFNWYWILLLNAGTFVASVLMMIGPSYLITKISPAKIIRYE